MSMKVFKVPVTESERGWGRKIDDYMVCCTLEDSLAFTEEFNAKNTAKTVPDIYWVVEDHPVSFEISVEQYKILTEALDCRMWLSALKKF